MEIISPIEVQELLNILDDRGYSSYLIGQGITDILLEKEPQAWLVATNATFQEISHIFPQVVYSASKEEYITVIVWQRAIEVFSLQGKSLEEYLKQQFFSVEALAYNWREKKIIDLFSAQRAIKNRLLEVVGNPAEFFRKQPLAMLKSIRLAAQYNFILPGHLINNIQLNASLSQNLPIDKVRDEIALTILAPKPSQYLKILDQTGIMKFLLPEINKALHYQINTKQNLGMHLLLTLDYLPAVLELRLAGLLHDLGKLYCQKVEHKNELLFPGHEDTSAVLGKKILDKLNFFTIVVGHRVNHHIIISLIRNHMFSYNPATTTSKGIERLISRIGIENVPGLMALRKADILAGSQAKQSNISFYHNLEKQLNKIIKLY